MTTFLPEVKISEKYASGPQLEQTLGTQKFKALELCMFDATDLNTMVKAVYNNKQNKFICKQCKYPFNIFGVAVCKRTSNTFRELITRNSTISRDMNCSLAKYGKEEVSRGGVVASSLLIAAFKWANDIKNLVHFVSYIQQMTASK